MCFNFDFLFMSPTETGIRLQNAWAMPLYLLITGFPHLYGASHIHVSKGRYFLGKNLIHLWIARNILPKEGSLLALHYFPRELMRCPVQLQLNAERHLFARKKFKYPSRRITINRCRYSTIQGYFTQKHKPWDLSGKLLLSVVQTGPLWAERECLALTTGDISLVIPWLLAS